MDASDLDNTSVNGLANIGNTCYMNSILQCLAHCRGLRDFFLLGQFRQQINPDNPIGSGGKTAEVFATLMQDLWNNGRTTCNASRLKHALCRKSDICAGYQQQDAQEFLSILLDTLHEDLNQGDHTKTFQLPDGDGKPNEEIANQSWNFHLQRNDSYFVKNFMGQFKSKVACMECGKISLTFDPYMYLSLPIPKERVMMNFLIVSLATPTVGKGKAYINFPSNGAALSREISTQLKISEDKLSLFLVGKSKIVKIYKPQDTIPASDFKTNQLVVQENKNSKEGSYEVKMLFSLSEPFNLEVCSFCGAEGKPRKCTKCKQAAYCNRECQTKHFKVHKHDCKEQAIMVCMPLVTYLKQKDLKYDKLVSMGTSSNLPITLLKRKKVKTQVSLKIANADGVTSGPEISATSKPQEFISAIEKGYYFVIEHNNANGNLTGQQPIEFYTHESTNKPCPEKSLGDCFEAFTQEEELPDSELWKCPRCKKLQKATKQISLYSCPNYLIVHLKRFQAKNIIMFDKVDSMIRFPLTSLDLSKYSVGRNNLSSDYYMYDLYGVSNHFGSLYRGHYTAVAKLSGQSAQWREFDDRNVSDYNENDVESRHAYVLFYKRRRFAEDISRGILSSEDEEDQEFFDADNVYKDSDQSDASCYYEAKVNNSLEEEGVEGVESLNIKAMDEVSNKDSETTLLETESNLDESPRDSTSKENSPGFDFEENDSQKTSEGCSDVSCDYVKVERDDYEEKDMLDENDITISMEDEPEPGPASSPGLPSLKTQIVEALQDEDDDSCPPPVEQPSIPEPTPVPTPEVSAPSVASFLAPAPQPMVVPEQNYEDQLD